MYPLKNEAQRKSFITRSIVNRNETHNKLILDLSRNPHFGLSFLRAAMQLDAELRERDRSLLNRPRREGVPHRVDPALLKSRSPERGIPVPQPEAVDLQIAATRSREEDRSVDPRRHRVERGEDASAERHEPFGHRLRALFDPAIRVPLADADQPRLAVDVRPLQRDPLLRSQTSPDREGGNGPVPLA